MSGPRDSHGSFDLWLSLSAVFSRSNFGSDIHVMLALRCSSRQIIVADEQLDGTDMVGELLGKRQRRAYQTRNMLLNRSM